MTTSIQALLRWLVELEWLTVAAWVLTLGCLGCAILDSYTSLCVDGATLGRIGSASACPDFGGWDTRVFPLAVDMGWGGALFAVLRLARSIGLRSWRWWVVLTFEVITAAFTVAGNAFHGAVVQGVTSEIPAGWMVLISSVTSAVPGVVAVGSGFTLSVLVSTREPGTPEPVLEERRAAVQVAPEEDGRPQPQPEPRPARRQKPSERATGRRSAGEVLAMVRAARERMAGELGREPSDHDVAAQVTADGHPITASRVRSYLAQLRAEERERQTEQQPEQEVVAWHAR
jgi:hypothetical protein